MATFIVDEGLPASLSLPLREFGHEATSVKEEGMASASDEQVIELCRSRDAVLITAGLDFADIRRHAGQSFPGVILLRLRSLHYESIVKRVTESLADIPLDAMRDSIAVVGPDSVRMRKLGDL